MAYKMLQTKRANLRLPPLSTLSTTPSNFTTPKCLAASGIYPRLSICRTCHTAQWIDLSKTGGKIFYLPFLLYLYSLKIKILPLHKFGVKQVSTVVYLTFLIIFIQLIKLKMSTFT